MRRILLRASALAGAALLSIGLYLGYLKLSGNFHEVIAGEFYRSGQPTAAQLADYANRYGIKTVINLRGTSDDDWYSQEIAESKRLGIRHVDFRMSARNQLSPERSKALIAIMRNAQKPILVHCQAGSDRSGLASVMYLQQIAKADEQTAERQLSLIYGHIGLPFLGPYAMDETWENLEKLFGLSN
ncbi:fused DSP-PTPase phosphatase/NAD kinase-like protein [Mycoplana dimorpha]|uniref:Protein tyrosine/serine phosphatase n=1 Tax=Mycoplana dimorpha TaxID=28320 RepID=A0A2T5BE45_MYCDI|nr:tyrosine-protein phosphatase [Mycoplana dimorpha]PTM97279.1 protein tyrosine/serine phosphatase [Mycoplana dimorpha]